jgi:hypothetical protein
VVPSTAVSAAADGDVPLTRRELANDTPIAVAFCCPCRAIGGWVFLIAFVRAVDVAVHVVEAEWIGGESADLLCPYTHPLAATAGATGVPFADLVAIASS